MPSLEELLSQGDVKQISQEAARRLSKDPQDGEALVALARVALLEGNDSQAANLLQRAAARADKQEVALVRAALSARRRDWKKARELYQSLATQEPVRDGALFGLGVSLLELGQYEEAREVLERLVARASPYASFHLELGRAYLFLGRARAAVHQLVRCLRLDRTEERAWYLLTNIVGSRGRQRRADGLLRLGLAQVPDSSLLRGLVDSGLVSSAPPPPAAPGKGLAPRAASAWRPPLGRGAAPAPEPASLPEDIHSDAYHVALGQQLTSLIQGGQGREALQRVREAQARGVRTLGFKLLEGWACEALVPPDREGARRVYEEAIESFPRHWLPRNALGQLLMQQGPRYAKEALQTFEAAVRCAPEEAEPRFNLAQAYGLGGRFAEGVAVARRLVEEVKDSQPIIHEHASRLLGQLEARLGEEKSQTRERT